MKTKFYRYILLVTMIMLVAGLYSCEKRDQPWADELGFPPSFFKLETDSMRSLNYSHNDQKDTILLKGDVVYSAFSEADWVVVSDRKSTRLNSSHVSISYAVFCLKKKKRY